MKEIKELEDKFITEKKLELELDLIVKENEVDFLEAIQLFVEENEIEYDDISSIILSSKSIKEKIEFAAIKTGKIKNKNKLF